MRLVPMRLGLLILLAVLLVLAVSVYALRSPGPGVVFRAPGLGPTDSVCVSLYGWAPNGSLVKLGGACGTGGEVRLPFNGVEAYLEAWRRSLEAMHDNPDWVEPGLIALVADTRPGIGVYGYIKAVAVNITRTLAAKRLTISLTGDETRTMMTRPLVQWREIASHTTQWPPRSITRGSSSAEWVLEKVYYSMQNVPIPVSIIRLSGDLKHFTNYDVELDEYISLDYYTKLTFTAIAGIGAGPLSVSASKWEVAGTILKLSPPVTKTYVAITIDARYRDYAKPLYTGSGLYTDVDFNKMVEAEIKPMGPDKDVLLAVGFIGDTAIAKYCLKIPLINYCRETATIAMARPKLYENLMYYWYEVDNNPEDGKGFAEKVFRDTTSRDDWVTGWNATSYGEFVKYFNTVNNDYATDPILSISIPVGAILGAEDLPVSPTFSATLGTESGYKGLSIVRLKAGGYGDDDIYHIQGLHPYQDVYYGGHVYQLGSAYCDVEVIKPGSLPPVPPGGAYPTKKIPAAPS